MDLKELWKEAQEKGWASGTGELADLQRAAAREGWEAVESRSGEGRTSVLRPVSRSAAHPRSISAVHGLGEQPLHVDGSHLPTPPDAIVLFCKAPNDTPTNLWRLPGWRRLPSERPPIGALSHGIFVVGSGPWAFLAPAMEGKKLRYDPTIMVPGDSRAREAAEYFRMQQTKATPFYWEEPSTFLVIDNRAVLHGRATLAVDDADREVVRTAFRAGVSK